MKPWQIAKLQIGDVVTYRLNMGSGSELRGPERVVDLKRDDAKQASGSLHDTAGGNQLGRITHVKLADSPCWVAVDSLVTRRSP